jgi:hypothetical protein
MKKCSKCHTLLPKSSFYKDKNKSSGLKSECKDCTKKAQKIYRSSEKYKEKAWEYQLKYSNTESGKIQRKAYNKFTKEKIKKDYCCICGKNENIEAHHDNYNNPLDIIFLCKNHHEEHHKEFMEMKKRWKNS